MRAGALRDNEVMPCEGIRAEDLSRGQRGLLLDLIGVSVHRAAAVRPCTRRASARSWLTCDETWFAWIGAFDDHQPFFYKVQSPVLL